MRCDTWPLATAAAASTGFMLHVCVGANSPSSVSIHSAARAETTPSPMVAAASGGFSLSDLQSGCPEGVDPANKEKFLSDADFQSVFGMDKAAWDKFPKWKRTAKKKAAGLF